MEHIPTNEPKANTRNYQLVVITDKGTKSYPTSITFSTGDSYREVTDEEVLSLLKRILLIKLKNYYLKTQAYEEHILNILQEESLACLISYNEDVAHAYLIQEITDPEHPQNYASYVYQIDEDGCTIQPDPTLY